MAKASVLSSAISLKRKVWETPRMSGIFCRRGGFEGLGNSSRFDGIECASCPSAKASVRPVLPWRAYSLCNNCGRYHGFGGRGTAGMPTTVAPAGTSRVTTALAPTVALSPIITPPRTVTPRPSQTSRPIVIGFALYPESRIGWSGSRL